MAAGQSQSCRPDSEAMGISRSVRKKSSWWRRGGGGGEKMACRWRVSVVFPVLDGPEMAIRRGGIILVVVVGGVAFLLMRG